jgi:hypothetical protein
LFQLNKIFGQDDDTKQRWNRVTGNAPPHFEITDKDFTTQADIDSGTKNNNALSLNTTIERQKGLSNHDLAVTVNAALMDNLKKAEKRKTLNKKISLKEFTNMNKNFDAASAFTAIVNRLDKTDTYIDFQEIHEGIVTKMTSMKEPPKKTKVGIIFKC